MFKSINLNKLISVGLLSVFLFAFSYAVVGAQDGDIQPEIVGVESFTKERLTDTITIVVNYIIGIVAIIAVVMIVWAGYLYITAGMDEKNVEKAKKMLLYGVIGIVVVILSYSIVSFARSFLG
ncbi:MAG: TrbC/VirB2 family protein [bacterium]|nr:TrbC/VirB2 family protein [bacterium]